MAPRDRSLFAAPARRARLASMDITFDDPGIRVHHLPISGDLGHSVRALVAVEVDAARPLPLAIAPHDSLMLSVQFGRNPREPDAKAALGHNTCLTGIRHWTGSFIGAGNCLSLFALLTPLGAVRLLESRPLQHAPRIRARVAELLDDGFTRRLEDSIVSAAGPEAKLRALGAWIEERAALPRRQDRSALRAARAAMALCARPTEAIERVADAQHVSRRQLERDVGRWIGASPRHLTQVARVQQVSREVRSGATLADAAAQAGFADQAHMTRVVRQLTGLTPRQFVASQRTPIAAGFRAATGGGTVYL
jgi:AraC-like DNA-binding protein